MNERHKNEFFPFVLDHKPGFLLSWILYRLFQRVSLDEDTIDRLKQIHRSGTLVYAVKYRGWLDYLLYHYRFRRSRVPFPKIAFDLNISLFLPLSRCLKVFKFYVRHLLRHRRLPSPYATGYFKDAIQEGTTSLLFLLDPVGFTRHFIRAEKDSLHFLLETQKEMQKPIYLVPHLILYKTTPEKKQPGLLDIFFGYRDKPGLIRKTALFFRHHRRAFIDFGEPLNLQAYLEAQPASRSAEELAMEVRQLLIDRIDRQKRVMLGPIMRSKHQLKEKVLRDPEVINTIERNRGEDHRGLRQQRKKAGAYFDEIAADYNPTYVQVFYVALSWFWKKIFAGIEVEQSELGLIRQSARKGPLIYVPSHKSHIDYLVLNYVLHHHHMHVPRVAAGKNLAFWPMGHIFRKSGAFFIRRTFKGAQLYPKIFTRYIKALLEEGHPLEFFIEGGRSRSGKLILPKIGFLSILLQAYEEGYCDDLIFVPASISYDRIMEEQAYLRELGGDSKEKENFWRILKARRFLKKKYGKIYVNFGEIISIKQFLDQSGISDEDRHRQLALHVIRSINRNSLVTPLALIATAMLSKHRRGFYLPELLQTAASFSQFLAAQQTKMAITLKNLDKAVEETLSLLINRKVLKFLEDVDETETFYYVDDEKKRELEYYKNSIIHFFIPYALLATCLLKGSEDVKPGELLLADYSFLKKLFKKEFVFDENSGPAEEMQKISAYFLDTGFIVRSGEENGFRLTGPGFEHLPYWAALAKTFLEAYWIATRALIQWSHKGRRKGDLFKNMNYLGVRLHKQGLIDHLEAVSRITFSNALAFINEDILSTPQELSESQSEALEKLSKLSQRIYELSRFRA